MTPTACLPPFPHLLPSPLHFSTPFLRSHIRLITRTRTQPSVGEESDWQQEQEGLPWPAVDNRDILKARPDQELDGDGRRTKALDVAAGVDIVYYRP